MVKIEKILVCVDFTPLSIKALEWAVDISQKYNAKLVIFHELEDVYTMIKTSASFGMPASPDLREKAEESVKQKLKSLLKDFNNYEFYIEAKGKTIERLPVVVSEVKPDLTVISIDYERDIPKIESQILVIK
ncbi:MAG: universal stress protein [Aquificae bacterium]|nr:universal stress protein [Aquificota bacterium]